MKKLGIIGGAGPLASALFYETLIKQCYTSGTPIPEIVLLNYPFTRGLSLEEGACNASILLKELKTALKILENNKVDRGVLVCNTLHLYLRMLPATLPFHHLPEMLMQEALSNGHKRLLILGTQNTCHHDLYTHPAITSVYPNSEEQHLVDKVVDAILQGMMCEEDAFLLSQLITIISRRDSIEGVVLGCTDLPVLHHHYPIQTTIKLYDSIKLPAKIILRRLS